MPVLPRVRDAIYSTLIGMAAGIISTIALLLVCNRPAPASATAAPAACECKCNCITKGPCTCSCGCDKCNCCQSNTADFKSNRNCHCHCGKTQAKEVPPARPPTAPAHAGSGAMRAPSKASVEGELPQE